VLDDAQAQAGASGVRLGGEEGLKDPLDVLRRHPAASVLETQLDHSLGRIIIRPYRPVNHHATRDRTVRRLDGVHQQREEQLLHVLGTSAEPRQRFQTPNRDLDLRAAGRFAASRII
jgi:hypothetical protein